MNVPKLIVGSSHSLSDTLSQLSHPVSSHFTTLRQLIPMLRLLVLITIWTHALYQPPLIWSLQKTILLSCILNSLSPLKTSAVCFPPVPLADSLPSLLYSSAFCVCCGNCNQDYIHNANTSQTVGRDAVTSKEKIRSRETRAQGKIHDAGEACSQVKTVPVMLRRCWLLFSAVRLMLPS